MYLLKVQGIRKILISDLERPIEAEEQEQLVRERNRNFDKKNPWRDIAEEWTGPKKSREYEIPIDALDRPPRRYTQCR